ncbi:hypothetical protein HPB47_015396 [Ixodes persulcatus]|uniref:Uncharacterized protein n=1 Tax=Ixodes persulcatus TaxID=34615 RepID=A0AC60QW69_IXOPE|nr:hypothetical protein HPB47_015396 [Ixodes persulcatus]
MLVKLIVVYMAASIHAEDTLFGPGLSRGAYRGAGYADPVYPSVPFSFGYDTVDEFGTKLFHKEDADASNSRTGSYGYTDANGLFRRVNYVADAGGFRATVDTNEPGTAPGQSADAVFNAKPVVSGLGARAPGTFGASAYGTAAAPTYRYGGKYGYAKNPYVPLGYGLVTQLTRGGVHSMKELALSQLIVVYMAASIHAETPLLGPRLSPGAYRGAGYADPVYPSVPFSFGYDTVDEFGTKLFHKEDADASNSRTGSYGYTDANGLFRRVNYVADAGGFRATVDTNEPGTAPGQSADAVFNAKPVVSGLSARVPGSFGASAYGTAAAPAYRYGGKYGYAKNPYVPLGYAREGVSSQENAEDEVYDPDKQRQRIKLSSRALLTTSLPQELNPLPASWADGLWCSMEESAPNRLHSGKAGKLENVKSPLVTT